MYKHDNTNPFTVSIKQKTRAGNLLIRSFRSNQMSDCEQIAQIAQDKWALSNREQIALVAHDKWATVSDSLRLLMINERMSNLLKKFWLKKSYFLVCFLNLKIKSKTPPLAVAFDVVSVASTTNQKRHLWLWLLMW